MPERIVSSNFTQPIPAFPLGRICIVALAILATTNCSFTATKRLKNPRVELDPIECTDELTFPLIDMAATVLSGVLAVSLISTGNSPGENSTKLSGYATAGISLTLASSAIFGIYVVNTCRNAKASTTQQPQPLPTSDTPTVGKRGSSCSVDEDCNSEFHCDPTMRVCVPPAEDSF